MQSDDRSRFHHLGRLRAWPGLLAATAWALASASAWAECKLVQVDIPVHVDGSQAIATMTLGDTELPMLLDSGAAFSMLSQATARQLRLPLHDAPANLRVQGVTGPIDVQLAKVGKVHFGITDIPNVEFLVGPNEFGPNAMGLMGRNFLSIADTEYDLAHGMVRLMFPQGDCGTTNFAYWAGHAPVNVVKLNSNWQERNAINVDVHVNGVDVDALMDTGAVRTTLNRDVARRAGIKDADMVPIGRMTGAGAGHAQAWLAPVAVFELGDEKIANNRLMIDDAGHMQTDMLLGIDYFLSHRVYVSRLQKKVYITWNGGAVFAQNKADAAEASPYAAPADDKATDDPDGLARRGEAEAARGDIVHALEDLDRAVAKSPLSAAFLAARARVHATAGQAAPALADLDAALKLDPTLERARLLRASLNASAGRQKPAFADLQSLDASLPPTSSMRAEIGNLYGQHGAVPQALHQWELWLGSHGDDANAGNVLNNRCWLRARMKIDLPLAVADCEKAVDADGDNALFRTSLGWACLQFGQPERALKSFDKAIALPAANAWAYYGRGMAQKQLGHVDAAAKDLEEARRMHAGMDADVKRAGFEAEVSPAAAVTGAGSAAGS